METEAQNKEVPAHVSHAGDEGSEQTQDTCPGSFLGKDGGGAARTQASGSGLWSPLYVSRLPEPSIFPEMLANNSEARAPALDIPTPHSGLWGATQASVFTPT